MGGRIVAGERERDDIVQMERVRDGDKISALERYDERSVHAWFVKVICETEALQGIECVHAIADPIRTPALRCLTGGLLDAGDVILNEPSLFRRRHIVAR